MLHYLLFEVKFQINFYYIIFDVIQVLNLRIVLQLDLLFFNNVFLVSCEYEYVPVENKLHYYYLFYTSVPSAEKDNSI